MWWQAVQNSTSGEFACPQPGQRICSEVCAAEFGTVPCAAESVGAGGCIVRVLILAPAIEKIFQQVQAASEWDVEQMFHDRVAFLRTFVLGFGLHAFHGDHRAQIFHEVGTAGLAAAALGLLVMAGGAFVFKGSMAARAIAHAKRRFNPALGALHSVILAAWAALQDLA